MTILLLNCLGGGVGRFWRRSVASAVTVCDGCCQAALALASTASAGQKRRLALTFKLGVIRIETAAFDGITLNWKLKWILKK